MNKEDAVSLALDYLHQRYKHNFKEGDIVILTDKAIETPYGWFFTYNTRAFVEGKDILKSLIGNGPILVLKSNAEIKPFASSHSILEAVHVYEDGAKPSD